MIHYYNHLSRENLTLYLHKTLEQAKLAPALATVSAETFFIHGPDLTNILHSLLCLRIQECAKDGNGSSECIDRADRCVEDND